VSSSSHSKPLRRIKSVDFNEDGSIRHIQPVEPLFPLDDSYDVWLDDAPRRNECGARSWQPWGHAICRGPDGHDGGHVWEVQ